MQTLELPFGLHLGEEGAEGPGRAPSPSAPDEHRALRGDGGPRGTWGGAQGQLAG